MKPYAALAAALLALAGCGGGSDDDSWAAKVDGVAIPATDLRRLVDERMEDSPDAKRQDVANDVLQSLLSDQVVLNLATKRHIEVSPAQVEERLLQLHGPDWKDPDPRYRETVRREMVLERTALAELGARARVPDSAQRAYFEEHRADYSTAARVQIRQIVVAEKPKAEQLRGDVEKGVDFAQLARANSIGPEAADGGMLPPFAKGELPKAFDRAFELEVGRVSPVIESPYGYHLFLLVAKLPAHEASFDEVHDKIELELSDRQLNDLRREWVRSLRKSADISVNDRVMESLQ